MSINPSSYQITVQDTPTLVIEDETSAVGPREDGRCTYEMFNLGPCEVYIGDDEVTYGTGIPLPVNASRTISIRHHAVLYAVADGAAETADVRVLRVP